MMAARAFMFRLKSLHLVGRVEVQNTLAGVAHHGLLPGTDIVISLRTQHNLASHVFVIANFGNTAASKLCNALVVAQQVFVPPGSHLIALATPFGELLFVLGRTLAG